MSRKALVVGINDYGRNSLKGCIEDAVRLHTLLFRHHDEKVNFQSRLWTAPAINVSMAKGPAFPTTIDVAAMRKVLDDFFFDRHCEFAIFYFAGHGVLNKLGGYLVTQNAQKYSEGLAMTELLDRVNGSPIPELLIILDCCHSGFLGAARSSDPRTAELRDGITILSACGATEQATEQDGHGVFTSLLCDGLDGGAADVQGRVTVASMYSYVEDALGAFEQRPYFKASVNKLASLRRCPPAVPHEVLVKLPGYFTAPGDEHPLDPSYEPDAGLGNLENQVKFRDFQILRNAHLLVPVGEPHLFYAAMRSKGCKLTPLGRAYWRLAKEHKLWSGTP